jgi:hypothetical protein
MKCIKPLLAAYFWFFVAVLGGYWAVGFDPNIIWFGIAVPDCE